MKLYHGSNMEIQKIDLSKSRPYKDFGRAFYLSESRDQAFDQGRSKVILFGGEVVVSCFEFDESVMTSDKLKIKTFRGYTEEWADFIFSNRDRKNKDYSHDYDIVYGPIANDNVGNQIFRYKEGYISFQEFLHNLKFKEGVTYQYAFCTERAVSELKKI